MYKNLKITVFMTIGLLAVLTIVAFSMSKNLNTQHTSKSQEFSQVSDNVSESYSSVQAQNKLESNTIKVSPETRDYIYNSEDPLKEVKNDEQNFEVPEIPNVGKTQTRSNEPMFKDFNPLKTETSDNIQKEAKNDLTVNDNIVLYNINNTKASDYDVMADFKLNDTQFYVIGYRVNNQQSYSDFIMRKYFIYKKSGNTIVQCFELFQRQERAARDIKSLISVKTGAEDTEIIFNSEASGVTRVVDNHQLLSPYGDKKDRVLLLNIN